MPWPTPAVPGVVRVVEVRVPRAVATDAAPSRSGVCWAEAPDDPEVWTAFEVLAEEPGAAEREAELDCGTELVGRVPRFGGGTIVVVSRSMTGFGGSLSFMPAYGSPESVAAAVAAGRYRALVSGPNPDGSVWFLELVSEGAAE